MSFEETGEFVAGGESYALLVECDAPASELRVTAERLATGETWGTELSGAQVEELTRRTGSAKRLDVFSKLLRAALKGDNASCSLDMLSTSDLAALKTRAPRSGVAQPARPKDEGRRFLIVTHRTDFDRSHYPLPLSPQGGAVLRPSAPLVASLRAEISALRAEAESAAVAAAAAAGSRDRPTTQLSGQLEALRASHAALQRRFASETSALVAELAARREGERAWRVRAGDARSEADALARRLRATEARVGLRGAAASANFTYALQHSPQPLSRPPSRPPSRPHSRGASSSHASPPPSRPASRDGSPFASPGRARRYLAAHPPRRPGFGSSAPRCDTPPPGHADGRRSGGASPAWGRGRNAASPTHVRTEEEQQQQRRSSRHASPSAALRDVHARLAAFTRTAAAGGEGGGSGGGGGEGRGGGGGGGGERRLSRGGGGDARGVDAGDAAIADIDARLHALQGFLRAAKAGGAAVAV